MDPRRHVHDRERAFVDVSRVEYEQIVAALGPAVDDTDQVAVTLGRSRVARPELTSIATSASVWFRTV